MTPKQRALEAFAGRKPDRVPLCIFLGGSWPVINAGTTLRELIGRPAETAGLFWQANRELKADIVMTGAGATALQIKALGGDVRFNENGAPEIMAEPLTRPDDLGGLSAERVYDDPDVRWLIETSKETVKLAGEDALVLASGRAPFTLAGQIFGLENLSRALYKNEAFAHRLLSFTTELSLTYYLRMIQDGRAHGAFIADPTASGDCISRRHFGMFALPYLIRVIDGVKRLGKPVMLHICGDITDRLPLIAQSGADCISIDAKVDLARAKTLVGGKIAVAGNIDPVNILEFGRAADVRAASLKCLTDGGDEGFILTPGCDFSAEVSRENLKMLSTSILEFNESKGDNACLFSI